MASTITTWVKSNTSPMWTLHSLAAIIRCCQINLDSYGRFSRVTFDPVKWLDVSHLKNTILRRLIPNKTLLIDYWHTAHYSMTRGPLLSKGHQLWIVPYGSPFLCSNYVKVKKNPICYFALLRNTELACMHSVYVVKFCLRLFGTFGLDVINMCLCFLWIILYLSVIVSINHALWCVTDSSGKKAVRSSIIKLIHIIQIQMPNTFLQLNF